MSSIQEWLNRRFACGCGQTHEVAIRHIAIHSGALDEVPAYLAQNNYDRVLLVADEQTMRVAGNRLFAGLTGADVCILLPDEKGEIAADEQAIVQVLLALKEGVKAILAVGSGTIHDIVRFACSKTGHAFISVPTAPSVDGFTSVGAPLILRGFKQTVHALAPEAMFADVKVMAGAPQAMIAAGFGDMLGKFTSLADWGLGRVLFDEAFCETAEELTRDGLRLCLDHVDEIAKGSELGVCKLMEALTLSGISMLLVGHSRPASGAEHHLSHFWEMNYLQERRRALLHGAKVGAATVLMAHKYAELAGMNRDEAIRRIHERPQLSREHDEQMIRDAFGAIAEQVIAENFPPSERQEAAGASFLAQRLNDRWEAVAAIARSVPAPEQLASLLVQVGGAASPEQLGISPALLARSLDCALFVRSRYTILRLMRFIGPETPI
ncbi:sn-glycerol-1-phosphate dehydrogenase [Paenibacillus thalictri]|uniref:sn-glycerol-1-phosphate dehydrogenase n=1 Tax=Paenibacillus thalictri TaxID=2527873 RepID=A0A4Q9DEM5_9BACL|nr:sn-glycerol-1-phosphate dehydrogenase [Paenibacillus thalictri]TBL70074.1 sn-glycerol-1-phosphate dehydrogenase [Paenibacillus thalictri]